LSNWYDNPNSIGFDMNAIMIEIRNRLMLVKRPFTSSPQSDNSNSHIRYKPLRSADAAEPYSDDDESDTELVPKLLTAQEFLQHQPSVHYCKSRISFPIVMKLFFSFRRESLLPLFTIWSCFSRYSLLHIVEALFRYVREN